MAGRGRLLRQGTILSYLIHDFSNSFAIENWNRLFMYYYVYEFDSLTCYKKRTLKEQTFL